MILRIVKPVFFSMVLAFLVGCTPDAGSAQGPSKDSESSHTHDEHEMSHSDHPNGHHEADAAHSYPLVNCPVTGAILGSMGEPIIERIDGREVRFCRSSCPEKFKSNPEEYSAKMDEAIVAAQSADYPLDVCVVSGEELGGDHGEPIDIVVENRMFRVCCKNCIGDIEAEPSEFTAVLDDALAGRRTMPAGTLSDHAEQDH